MTVSSSTSASSSQSTFQQIQSDYQQLQQSLQSNNLKGAQSAYAAIQKLENQNGVNSNSSSNHLAAVGQALQQGNLAGAQSALQALQSKSHHHHHHGGSESTGSNSETPSTGSWTPGTLNIQA